MGNGLALPPNLEERGRVDMPQKALYERIRTQAGRAVCPSVVTQACFNFSIDCAATCEPACGWPRFHKSLPCWGCKPEPQIFPSPNLIFNLRAY
jgi:hypothetical protein